MKKRKPLPTILMTKEELRDVVKYAVFPYIDSTDEEAIANKIYRRLLNHLDLYRVIPVVDIPVKTLLGLGKDIFVKIETTMEAAKREGLVND